MTQREESVSIKLTNTANGAVIAELTRPDLQRLLELIPVTTEADRQLFGHVGFFLAYLEGRAHRDDRLEAR